MRPPNATQLCKTPSTMYVRALKSTGFRNLKGRIPLAWPLAFVLGENNSGKSNLIDALRLILEPEAGPHARRWASPDDFRHDGKGNRLGDTFELEVEIAELTDEEAGRMVTCLSPSLGERTAKLRMVATRGADDRISVEWYGGDSAKPDIERWAREAVRYTYLHPLRDAASDLRPGRDNRLVGLVGTHAPVGHTDRADVEKVAQTANEALGKIGAITASRDAIQTRIGAMTGSGTFTQRSDLAFAEPRFEKIVATLRAMAGALEPLELRENGLGYNNLIYMAVLLAGLEVRRNSGLNVLLVEEPEAHLHPQLQDLLMRHLENESDASAQVVVTTHSPNFAASARAERATIFVPLAAGAPSVARTPADFGMDEKELRHLHRFLDVTKAALLFARGVILVEGIAEQLLVPAFARYLKKPLPPAGIAVINVGGVAFKPFTSLFGPDLLPYRCVVVSDADPPMPAMQEEDAEPTDSAPSPEAPGHANPTAAPVDSASVGATRSARAESLLALNSETVRVVLSTRTLEWDLVVAGNWELLVQALASIKPRSAARLGRDHADSERNVRADALLLAVEDSKGPFAQELADLIDAGAEPFTVPEYLAQAIDWAHGGGL